MADNETIADIRKDAETKFRELVEAYIQRRSSFQTTMGAMQAFNNVFDRLEAAHKREVRETVTDCNQFSDAAKLREALELIVNERGILDSCRNNLGSKTLEDWDKVYKTLRRWIDKAMSALSATATAEKSSAVGDVAKLRGALAFCADVLDEWGGGIGDMERATRMAYAALSSPPRNCDVGSVAEQKERFKDFCKEGKLSRIDLGAYCAYDCPCRDSYDCKLEWAQMPYEEGGEK